MTNNPSIFQQLTSPNHSIIELLTSEGGQAMLDQEIMKIRQEIGEEQFHQYAQQFFKNSNINYKHFFNIETKEEKLQGEKESQKREERGEVEIQEQHNVPQAKQEQPQQTQLQVIQSSPQHTNNSQQSIDAFQQISRTPLSPSIFKIQYKNGDTYQGELQQNIKSGWGTYNYSSGQKYCGCFIDDQINGYGRYYFLSGAQYEGDWSSGMKHGIGILTFGNKDVYEGEFARDDLYGKGVYKYANGDRFQGIFKEGKRWGHGVFTGADGRLQVGEWVEDKFEI